MQKRVLALLVLLSIASGTSRAQGVPVSLAAEFGEPVLGIATEPNLVEVRFAYCTLAAAAMTTTQASRISLQIVRGAATISPTEVTVNPGNIDEDGCARSLSATVRVVAGWSATVRAYVGPNFPLANATSEGDTPPMRAPETRSDERYERIAAQAAAPPLASPARPTSIAQPVDADPSPFLLAALLVAGGFVAVWRFARRRI